MTSISSREKKSESDGEDTNNAPSSKKKEAEIGGKDNETDTGTDNTDQDTQVKDLQSAEAQFENPSGDQSGNMVVDSDDSKPVEEKGGGLSEETENVHREKDDSMPTQQTRFSGFQQNKQDQIVGHTGKTTNASHPGKKENEKNDSESDVGSSADSGELNVTKEETTKLIPSAPQTKTNTGKHVNEKSTSKSDVGLSGDSGQVKVDDEKMKPIPSDSPIKRQPHSTSESQKRTDEGDVRKPEIKEEEKMTQIPSDSRVKKQPHSTSETLKRTDEGDDRKPEIKEEKMTQIPSDSRVKRQPHSTSETQKRTDEGDVRKPEIKEEKMKPFPIGSPIKKQPHSTFETQKRTDEGDDRKPEIKEEEKMTPIPSDSPIKRQPHSTSETQKRTDEWDVRKPEIKKEKMTQIPSDFRVKKQPHSTSKTLKRTDEGGVREPEIKEEGSPQHPPYSGLPQQRSQQIREGTDSNLTLIGIVVILVSVVCGYYLHFSGSTPNKLPEKLDMVEVFNQEMEKLQASFPSQRPELWKRSLIHIRRHLKTEHPTEPVSLILTSGRSAEKTLGCLAQCLAQAFSATRNSTFLSIDGKAKTSLDSDQVKLDIDSELIKAFESEKFAAVIHRFEELPPGSTLIFYRYCDHENAAYKNVFLAFTVMLDAEAEVPPNINLGRIEEMVQDHVKQKFVSSDKSAVFNQMDVDKLSGLWSRISHLILPVVAEERIEQQGCVGCG